MKHIQTFEGYMNEGINHQKLLKKISDILGVHYKASYDKKTDCFFVKSDLYKYNNDQTEFYEDIKEDLMSEGGIEIGGLEVYSNTEISFTVIKVRKINESNEQRGFRRWEYNVKTKKATVIKTGVMAEVGIEGFWYEKPVNNVMSGCFELSDTEEDVINDAKRRLKKLPK